MKSCIFVLVLGALCAAEIVHQTKPGQTQMLNCGITGASKWMRGNNLLHSEHPSTGMPLKGKGELVQRSRLKQGRHLEISKITPQDAGLFTCSGKGQEEQHRLIVSSASVSPSGRLEVGSEATLQCEVSGLPQGAVVEWVRPGGQRQSTSRLQLPSVALADTGPWKCVFSAGDRTLGENVTLEVTEPRPKTTAAPSTTRTTEHANIPTCLDCDAMTQEVGLLGLSWWVWAAVGGGCLVLLLWVLILVMYNRMKRRKRRFMKMRKADQLRPKQYCRCPGGPTAAAGQRGKKLSAPPFTAPVYATP